MKVNIDLVIKLVPCPSCGAAKREPCKFSDGSVAVGSCHLVRSEASKGVA